MSNDRFKVASTLPSIKDKLKINILDDTDQIYWYIKFNLHLDKTSVTNKTMQVIDTDGYIMRTYITYDTYRHVIVVSPIDSYIENKYYILSISKKVKSEKGQHLKKEIHIMFKLMNHKISKFEILKSTVKVPDPRPRPEDYDQMMGTLYTFTKENDPFKGNTLPFLNIKVNFIPALLGIPIIISGFFMEIIPMFFAGVVLFSLGFFIVLGQVFKNRSKIIYNLGAYHFNKGNYAKAHKHLYKAFAVDKENEHAEYGLERVRDFI